MFVHLISSGGGAFLITTPSIGNFSFLNRLNKLKRFAGWQAYSISSLTFEDSKVTKTITLSSS